MISPIAGSTSPTEAPPPSEAFLLVIVDRDTRRFTIEGPMTDAADWTREIAAARKAGRRITYRIAPGALEAAVKMAWS